MPKIYCLKISQRMLQDPKIDYWPFDRCYLMHRDTVQMAPKMFRYYFYLLLTDDLLKTLNVITVEAHREITVVRDNEKFEYSRGSARGQFSWITDASDWTIVVPTHVKGKYKDRVAVSSFIDYIMTKAVCGHDHNKNINLPQIAMHTPKREIKFMCAICTNLPNYDSGKCKPGTLRCKQAIDTELPFDDHFRLALKKSIDESGGEA